MKLELPMIVTQPGPRQYVTWIPHLPSLHASGPSLAELRDDLALAVMIAFEKAPPSIWRRFQLPPHLRLRHVDVKSSLKDRKTGKRLELAGKVPVLLEKWPADSFWVATPTRMESAAFALVDPDALEAALPRKLAAYCLEHELDDLDKFVAEKREHLDILEVDADPPTILPRGVRRPPPRPARRTGKAQAAGESTETPAERDERRRKRRLHVKALREAGTNLSHGAQDDTLERAFGREALVEQVVDELLDREGAAIVLVGPPGAGKTAIVHEVTRRLGVAYAAAHQRRDVWRVDGGRFIAGQSFVGQWEARARLLADELAETGDILFADDLTSLIYAGRTGGAKSNLASYLEPQLGRGEIAILGECTPERWAKAREEEPGFTSHFRVIEVPPLDARRTLTVLLGVLRDLESETDAGPPPRLAPAALEALLDGAARFRPHEAFPGKAVRLLRRLVTASGQPSPSGDARLFDVADVHALVHAETGLPPFVIGAEAPRAREAIRRDLAAHVAGQADAVDAITDVVLAMQAGLGDADKPLATLLLVGPTGVGKTETAKALARYLFGSAARMLRFDMSEMTSPASLARFTGHPGAPDGELTTALRSQPLRVILFDEIEKAHPRVFDALLQLLGEGRLTDAAGRLADARQAVILMTSNLGVREAAARPGFVSGGDASAHYVGAVRAFFRPEFFNRIDRVVPYRPLDKAALRVVVEHALAELLSRRGIARGHVQVDVEPALLDQLVEQAFDPRYGARPLKRLLERHLTVPLAHHLATRRGDDLALVELYRAEGRLGLDVRLLADAARVEERDPPASWTLPRTIDELRRLGSLAGELRVSPLVTRLGRERAAALAVGQASPDPAAAELLDALRAVEERLAPIDVDELSGWSYEEHEDPRGYQKLIHRRPRYGSRVGHMGLGPKQGFIDVPVAADPDSTLRQMRPLVAALRDQLTLLVHRLRSFEARGADTLILLFEGVGARAAGGVEAFGRLGMAGTTPIARWNEVLGDDGKLVWQPEATEASQFFASGYLRIRRRAFFHEGPGLREIFAALAGWGMAAIQEDGADRLVRIDVLEGSGIEAIAAHDAERAAARAARRAAPPGPLPPEIITMSFGEHLATGRRDDDPDALHAAILRSRA